MPFIEYMLLAILGSSPTTTEGTPSARTLTAEAITQPSGGAEANLDLNSGITLLPQDTGGCKGMAGTGKKPLHHQRTARHHRTHKGGKVINTRKGKEPRNATSKS